MTTCGVIICSLATTLIIRPSVRPVVAYRNALFSCKLPLTFHPTFTPEQMFGLLQCRYLPHPPRPPFPPQRKNKTGDDQPKKSGIRGTLGTLGTLASGGTTAVLSLAVELARVTRCKSGRYGHLGHLGRLPPHFSATFTLFYASRSCHWPFTRARQKCTVALSHDWPDLTST